VGFGESRRGRNRGKNDAGGRDLLIGLWHDGCIVIAREGRAGGTFSSAASESGLPHRSGRHRYALTVPEPTHLVAVRPDLLPYGLIMAVDTLGWR